MGYLPEPDMMAVRANIKAAVEAELTKRGAIVPRDRLVERVEEMIAASEAEGGMSLAESIVQLVTLSVSVDAPAAPSGGGVADAFQFGGWTEVVNGMGLTLEQKLAVAQRVADWLRARGA